MTRSELMATIESTRESDPMQILTWSRASDKHKYFYMLLGKVASQTIRFTLAELEHPVELKGASWDNYYDGAVPKLGDHTNEQIHEILTSPQWYRFCFVRNPYHRLYSAYKSKIGYLKAEPHYQLVQQEIREEFNYPVLDGESPRKVAFRDFVRFVQSGKRWFDLHWIVQSKRLMTDKIQYDFIGRMESFADDFETVLRHLNASPDVMSTGSKVRNSTGKRRLSEVYDEVLADAVYEIYKADFEAFGYRRDSWTNDGGDEQL